MSSRAFCRACNAEVEDAGGFCLLGHRLSALAPPPPPPPVMTDLKAVARAASAGRPEEAAQEAFGEAQAVVSGAPEAEAPPPSRYTSSIERTWAELESAPPPSIDDPINTFAPPPRMDWGPRRSAFRLKLRRDRAEASV